MPLFPSRLTLSLALPRALVDVWGGTHEAEAVLRRLGVWPTAPVTEQRWRTDYERGGYVVDLMVVLPPEVLP